MTDAIALPPPITAFLAEMAADRELVHSVSDFTKAFENLERECAAQPPRGSIHVGLGLGL